MISRPLLLGALAASTLITAAFGAEKQGFALQEQPDQTLDVTLNGKRIARYMFAHDISNPVQREMTYKPYLHVFDAEGKAPITKGAGGSFPHHRGIYIGWNKLNVAGQVYDRWHMKGGEQIHRKFLSQKAEPGSASFTSLVEWMGRGTDPALVEERTLTFLPAPAPAYAIIDMASKLKAVAGETVLDGDPEHAGLQFRPAQEVTPAETVYVFPGENPDLKKDRDLPWFGETFTLRNRRYSVVYLNHPSNPKGAITSAYRDYGRFGTFFKETIPAGGEKEIKVRFVIAEGEMLPAETIQKHWNEYAGANEPTPTTSVRKVKPPKEPAKAAAPAAEAAAAVPAQ